jgi:cyclase
VIASIDYQIIDGVPVVFSQYGSTRTKYNLFEFIKICEDIGVGEIFLQNIQLDGTAQGFDQEIITKVVDSTILPVIACSGAGIAEQFSKPAKIKGLSALAGGNIFNFTERAYPNVKKCLKEDDANVR